MLIVILSSVGYMYTFRPFAISFGYVFLALIVWIVAKNIKELKSKKSKLIILCLTIILSTVAATCAELFFGNVYKNTSLFLTVLTMDFAKKEQQILEITTENIKLDSALKLSNIVSTGGHAKILIEEERMNSISFSIDSRDSLYSSFSPNKLLKSTPVKIKRNNAKPIMQVSSTPLCLIFSNVAIKYFVIILFNKL